MMNIILVEDEDPKRRHLEQLLLEQIADLRLRVARSVNSAIEELEDSRPDLLLLDMSLPTFDVGDTEGGGRPQGFGGIEVVRHMKLSGLRCPLIVITGYEAFPKGAGQVKLATLEKELRSEFPDMINGVLHFNSAFDEWKEDLLRLMSEIPKSGD
jgi:CheY-like chemotaxis protein